MRFSFAFGWVALCASIAVAGPSHSAGSSASGIVAVPGAAYAPSAMTLKRAPAQRLLADDAPRHRIALSAPGVAERGILKSANASRASRDKDARRAAGKGRPLAIGYGRAIPAAAQVINGSALSWVELADGSFAARVDISSEGAAAVRLALAARAMDPDVGIRFVGSGTNAEVFGPYPINVVADATARNGAYWSPVLEGATATLEIQRPADVAPATLQLTLSRVSHLAVAGERLRKLSPRDVADIGSAEFCEIDVACVTPPSPALRDAAAAVAKTLFTGEDGLSSICSGTLLNDSTTSGTPYFFTANHCIDSATAAETLNTYWFFDAVSCGSLKTPPYVLKAGGATLLGRSDDWDWSLVRLKESPPIGSYFAAWRAEELPPQAIATAIHHPNGDLKKWSQGTTQGYQPYDDGSSFLMMRWNQGSTEPGSSGSGLFTFLAAGGYYELRGGLWAGDASCVNRAGIDEFSRLDQALPYLRQYLTPDSTSATGVVPVVEFYHRGLDHYFISTDPVEINNLDTGVLSGWVRTGLRFLAYSDPARAPSNATPVCRFYMRPEFGDSHFYSASPAECAQTAARFGESWIYESPNVFYIQLPDTSTGACVPGTRPVWRFLNSVNTNHRYTAEVAVRDDLRNKPWWIPEGYGADAVIMCSPEN
jgi:lysyl endopeptidase